MRRVRQKPAGLTIRQKDFFSGLLFVSPWMIGLCVFFAFPFLNTVRLSFSQVVQMKGFQMEWVGLEHYKRAFLWEIEFLSRLGSVFLDAVINLPLIIVFSLIIAVMVNKKIVGKSIFRSIFFLPVLLGTGYIMQQLLGSGVDDQLNVVYTMDRGVQASGAILEYLGPTVTQVVQTFLNRITQVLWASGVQTVLFLSGLCGISPSLYEAATVEGATEWESFWKITLPMISPVLLLNVVYTLIDSFTNSDNRLVQYIFELTQKSDYAYGATISWLYFMAVFAFILLVFLVLRPLNRLGER